MWSKVDPPNAAQVRDAFGVEVNELQPHSGGFEADGFTDGRWFVKSWRDEPDSHRPLALTAELAARGIPSLRPREHLTARTPPRTTAAVTRCSRSSKAARQCGTTTPMPSGRR